MPEDVGSSIARELLAHKHEILLIDEKPEVIGRSGLRGAHWLVGDACELSTLQDAKLEDADVVVSATGDDKVNLVVSLLAKTNSASAGPSAASTTPRTTGCSTTPGASTSRSTPRSS